MKFPSAHLPLAMGKGDTACWLCPEARDKAFLKARFPSGKAGVMIVSIAELL